MQTKKQNKYVYATETSAWQLRVIYVYGLASWVLVVIGSGIFLHTNLFFSITMVPIIVFFSLYYLISYTLNFFYKPFSSKLHRLLVRKFWQTPFYPLVDVFLPICGENIEVLRNTFRAVSKMNYPNMRVYVLDDKGLKEHARLARKMHFTYLSRTNKGYMKKAGNIKHGYERSKGVFIAIFDADFAPRHQFLIDTLPYMQDQNIAIIQTPQYFQTDDIVHDRSFLEYGASSVQEDFYRYIQVARDTIGAPVCCGSNALYRRAALEAIGGPTQIEHSEDIYTGFQLLTNGWKVKYLPLILATGLCPENLLAYFHQQHRWCSGSMILMFDSAFWKSTLSWPQKLCFISGFMYYVSYPLAIVFSLQIFFVLLIYGPSLQPGNAIYFLPTLLFSFLILPLFRLSKPRPGNFLARTVCVYSYTHAVIMSFFNKTVGWEPTNSKSVSVSRAFRQITYFNIFYSLLYIGLVGLTIHQTYFHLINTNYFSMIFWITFNAASIFLMLWQFYVVLDRMKVKEMKETARGSDHLLLWRLQSVGGYALAAGTVLIFAVH